MDFKRKLVLGSLFLLAIFQANSAEPDRKTSQQTDSFSAFASFDQFIDKSIGDEVPESIILKTDAYRARQVNKTIWRLIDRKGYYFGLEKDFDSWCTSHSGTYQPLEGGANCLDQADNTKILAGYRVVITTTAAYEGNMTAGYARIFFMRSGEMQIVDAREKAQAKALSDQKAMRKSVMTTGSPTFARTQSPARTQILDDHRKQIAISSSPRFTRYASTSLG